MLKPSVQMREESGVLTAEFWDCLRLDPAPITDLRKGFEEYRRKAGKDGLVVDLNGVTFAGSASLGGFLAIRKLGAKLVFCNVDPNVREVFRVSRLEHLFSFATDKAAAIAMAEAAAAPGEPGDGAASPTPRPAASSAGPLRRRKSS